MGNSLGQPPSGIRGRGPDCGPPDWNRLVLGPASIVEVLGGALAVVVAGGLLGGLLATGDALADELADELPDDLTDELAESLDDALALEAAVADSLFDAEPLLEPHSSMVIVHVALSERRTSR